jgi:pimeloyl-ACP methyl ester carboxylesterase
MTTIHYQREGDGPPLLLLHATLSSSRQLRALASELARRFSVVSVDRRGSGMSASAARAVPIDVATHIDDLVALARAESLGPAVVVGHSYGACVALELAARQPALVGAVFAYEPPYGPLAPPAAQQHMAQVARRTLAAAADGDMTAAALAFMEGVSGAAAVASLSPAARARIGRAGQGAVADATLSGMRPDGLGAIRCPTRVVSGRASAQLYADIADALVERIPAASHQRLDGVGHMAPILQPATIAAAITAFVDEVALP